MNGSDDAASFDRREPQRAFVNGAALAALTGLIEGLRSDVREDLAKSEHRLVEQMGSRFADHEKTHALAHEDELEYRATMLRSVGALQAADAADAERAKLAEARREGRLDLIRWVPALVGSIQTQKVWWLLVVAAVAAFAGGLSADFVVKLVGGALGIKP